MTRGFREKGKTIKDVAALAGVSVATVGRVIGNYGKYSEESREKVEKAVKELNYIPNAIAQGMRKHTTKTVAVIVPNIMNNFFSRVVGSIERIARKEGYNLLICNTHESQTMELQYMEMLHSKQVDGILLATTFSDIKSIPSEAAHLYLDLPIVLFDRRIQGIELDIVESEHEKGAYEATKYLLSLGHKKIAAVGASTKHITTTFTDRVAGYKKALSEAGVRCSENYILSLDLENPKDIVKKLEPLLSKKEITAILILNNSLCASVLQEFQKMKLKYPDDISIVNWDDEKYCELLGITTIDQQFEAIGKYAAERLFYQIDEKDSNVSDKMSLRMKTRLIVRGSCRTLI